MTDRSRPRDRIAARLRQVERDQQHRDLKIIAAVLTAGGVLIAGWALGWFGPEITLESSDGLWADRELQEENRNYIESVALFMQYRIECDADAVLYRATPMPWWNPLAWPSIAFEDKWRIPYRQAQATAPPTGIPRASCPARPEEWPTAQQQARDYLESL